MSDLGTAIAGHLRMIRTAWPRMIAEGPRTGTGEPVKGSKTQPLPVPAATLDARRETCQTLASWCRLVIDDAVDVGGCTMTVQLDGRDAVQMAGWLLVWADFLGAHDAGSDADAELGRAARLCDAVAREVRRRRFKVGPCIEHGTTELGERVPCPGTLYARLSSDDDLLPSTLVCDLDEDHAYPAGEWRRLGDRIHSAGRIGENTRTFLRGIATA